MGSRSQIAPHPHPHAWYQFGALLSGHPVDILSRKRRTGNLYCMRCSPSLDDIQIGSASNDSYDMVLREAVRSVPHPKWDEWNDYYDYNVGVTQVRTPFDMSAVERPIALVNVGEVAAAGEQGVITGYGNSRVGTSSLL